MCRDIIFTTVPCILAWCHVNMSGINICVASIYASQIWFVQDISASQLYLPVPTQIYGAHYRAKYMWHTSVMHDIYVVDNIMATICVQINITCTYYVHIKCGQLYVAIFICRGIIRRNYICHVYISRANIIAAHIYVGILFAMHIPITALRCRRYMLLVLWKKRPNNFICRAHLHLSCMYTSTN